MKFLAGATVALFLGGCASHSGVVPAGGDTLLVTKQAATGFSGLGNLKAEALQEASDHCTQKKRGFDVVSVTESKPPYLLGNYPRVDLKFRCTD